MPYQEPELMMEKGDAYGIDASQCAVPEDRYGVTSPTSKSSESVPRKLQRRTFPLYTCEVAQSSQFVDVKIVNLFETEGLVTLTVVLIDRQELVEEALSLIEPETLKPLYSSDLLSKNPGVMKYGESWVRVVVVGRPSPNTCIVHLVDYGEQARCSVTEVFCCPPEFVPIEMCTVDYHTKRTKSDPLDPESFLGQVIVLGHSSSGTFEIFSRETGEAIAF
ncbi:uncharacterized protein LOC100904176 [Galendromus occidentalis]|uniref:Uncharacterized protein LOC100904176 n=1 Tax=Galendromus occidentalis TaxID=34638 RepID=A0AAJ6QSD6_9ACAR|nr:uncharacterized protein LOC100904176 [Galendromus occidentalis]